MPVRLWIRLAYHEDGHIFFLSKSSSSTKVKAIFPPPRTVTVGNFICSQLSFLGRESFSRRQSQSGGRQTDSRVFFGGRYRDCLTRESIWGRVILATPVSSRRCGLAFCVKRAGESGYLGDAFAVLARTLDVDPHQNISQEKFEEACIVLLRLIISFSELDFCNKFVDLSSWTVDLARNKLLNSTLGIGLEETTEISANALTRLLQQLQRHLKPQTGDNEHQGIDIHNGENIIGEGDMVPGASQNMAESLVVRPKCLSAGSLLYYMGAERSIPVSSLSQLASILLFKIVDGASVEERCLLLPRKEDFMNAIFNTFALNGDKIDIPALESLMTKLEINPEALPVHDHDEHHKRRKRNVENNAFFSLQRKKREHLVPEELTTCYSAAQLMALFDSLSGMDRTSFQQLSPALVSQKIFARCSSTEEEHEEDEISDAERYGYGTAAIAIICISAVFGVFILPCTSSRVYTGIMSTFIGLAMGTLFADAVLHLIPAALGVHVHGEGHHHDHGSKIVIENFVRYGLVVMAGVYGFYLLETTISRFGGQHSHGQKKSDGQNLQNIELNEHPLKSGGYSEEISNDEGKTIEDEASVSSKGSNKLSTLALMVLLGDSVHNFADGLAVGAAFSTSISSGVATSIAIFCHEVPHELGDFAVLLQSGCSFKKALFLNFICALTAFLGFYVGIVVATDDSTKSYIFSVTAAMFMYIALVDLLPQLIQTSSNFHLLLNNIGILTGYSILFVIAVFEEHIII
ncbi:Zinc transporter zip12 [Plakobranchus ocellatus]|uniref:Zinc transporter zip12 n=1 Tax=Plakobranchus ocellatus TaxID=259542 RepID=A0AAV3YKV3_9GAST|nr:Zinc transporter zip12 [Plakobranchus ocellatus]